jgi:hypothetical protein
VNKLTSELPALGWQSQACGSPIEMSHSTCRACVFGVRGDPEGFEPTIWPPNRSGREMNRAPTGNYRSSQLTTLIGGRPKPAALGARCSRVELIYRWREFFHNRDCSRALPRAFPLTPCVWLGRLQFVRSRLQLRDPCLSSRSERHTASCGLSGERSSFYYLSGESRISAGLRGFSEKTHTHTTSL